MTSISKPDCRFFWAPETISVSILKIPIQQSEKHPRSTRTKAESRKRQQRFFFFFFFFNGAARRFFFSFFLFYKSLEVKLKLFLEYYRAVKRCFILRLFLGSGIVPCSLQFQLRSDFCFFSLRFFMISLYK